MADTEFEYTPEFREEPVNNLIWKAEGTYDKAQYCLGLRYIEG